jgi:hypothetical protein
VTVFVVLKTVPFRERIDTIFSSSLFTRGWLSHNPFSNSILELGGVRVECEKASSQKCITYGNFSLNNLNLAFVHSKQRRYRLQLFGFDGMPFELFLKEVGQINKI